MFEEIRLPEIHLLGFMDNQVEELWLYMMRKCIFAVLKFMNALLNIK